MMPRSHRRILSLWRRALPLTLLGDMAAITLLAAAGFGWFWFFYGATCLIRHCA